MAPADQLREAQERNEELVTHLERTGALRDPAVGAAFRAVLRHNFLPGRPLSEVYEDAAIMTRVGERGVPVSSSSQPAIMAIMLQLLQVLPGHRVLEIGAGTGYNAALLAHLVGPDGHVVTLDIDEELAAEARAHLAAAGVSGVAVAQADGATGWPENAPYDRIIVTAGADDLAPAWLAQLVEEGRLVLPLGLGTPAQHCVALVRYGDSLTSAELCPCGFMPLRGSMAPDREPLDDQMRAWLEETPRQSGHRVPAADFQGGFPTWLTLRHGAYVVGARLPEGSRSGLCLRDERGLALLSDRADDGGHPVLVFAGGDAAAARLIDAHRAWTRHRPGSDQVRIAAYRAGRAPRAQVGVRALHRPHFTFLVSA